MTQLTDQVRVLVLGGGPDGEREVSLRSSQGVADALSEVGYRVHREVIAAPGFAELEALVQRVRPDVIFPVLHGPWGEGGPLQDMLECLRLPFVGCAAQAARTAMDKIATKFVAHRCGVPTPACSLLHSSDNTPPLSLPVVLKPVHEGSTLGFHLCRTHGEYQAAVHAASADRAAHPHRVYMVEQACQHFRELTAGVLDGSPLPLVEIRPKSGVYDYGSKYTAGQTDYLVAPKLPDGATAAIQGWATQICNAIGVPHLARVDFLLEGEGDNWRAWMLEVNTLPGFTGTSLFPMAAKHVGVSYQELVVRLVSMALRDRVIRGA
jgi:D-alanine-D-alanine ligase